MAHARGRLGNEADASEASALHGEHGAADAAVGRVDVAADVDFGKLEAGGVGATLLVDFLPELDHGTVDELLAHLLEGGDLAGGEGDADLVDLLRRALALFRAN